MTVDAVCAEDRGTLARLVQQLSGMAQINQVGGQAGREDGEMGCEAERWVGGVEGQAGGEGGAGGGRQRQAWW